MNLVAMMIISHLKEYWPSQGLNQRPPALKSCALPTELRGSVQTCYGKIYTEYGHMEKPTQSTGMKWKNLPRVQELQGENS